MDFKGEGDQIRTTTRVAPTIQRLHRPVESRFALSSYVDVKNLVLFGGNMAY